MAAMILAVGSNDARAFKAGVALSEIHPGHGFEAYKGALERIRDLNAGWTLIPVYGYMDSSTAQGISADWEPPCDFMSYRHFVRKIIREAHRQKLSVLLVPYLNIRNGPDGDWRGNIRPPEWTKWFDSYRAFLFDWVEVCRKEGVAMTAVGAELVSSEHHVDEWAKTIAGARSRFRGQLIYSCNWDHFREVAFLDDLDAIGISGYYSLPYDAPFTQSAVESNWREVRADLALFSHEVGRPIIFTEIGHPSIHGAVRDPWNYVMDGQPDPEEQARALTAFIQAWSGAPELQGVFIWNYSPFRSGPLDTSYSIAGKPAQSVVRSWFSSVQRPSRAGSHSR